MSEQRAAKGVPTSEGLFARNATGLVRSVTPWSAYALNFISGTPVQALGYGLFFAFAIFPGGNFLLAGLLTIPLTLSYAYSFGLLTAMIPRTGGDYMLVSRVLTPGLGLISSFCMTVSVILSVAFFGILVTSLGLSPGLIALGLIGHSPTLVDWGNSITSTGWKFVIGSVLFILGALIHAVGWKWTARLQTALLGIVMLGLVVAGAIALFTSKSEFASNFNSFAQAYTNNPDSYHQVIDNATKAGVNVSPGFSFSNTIPLIGIFASFGIYSWFATFVGGELRQARSVKTAHNMALAGVMGIVLVLVFAAIFLRTFGTEFMTAANSSGLPEGITAAPTYFFLIAASVDNTALAWFLVISYLLFWPLITFVAFMQPTRMIFAYAFDGILPKFVTRLSGSRAPYVALLITVLLTEAVYAWAVRASNIFSVIVYAVLIQLVAMALVGFAAVVVPWRRPELYRAAGSGRSFAGIPVVSIAGFVSILSSVFIWWLYFHYAGFGLTDKTDFLVWVAATVVGAVIFYGIAREVRRRQGVDLSNVYAEIPPE